MEIIPAIDIIKGKCVRLIKGEFNSKKTYNLDLLRIAKSFQKMGLKRLHLVDLDGAKEGKIKNWQTIKKITQNTNLLIEFGGGVREEKDIEKLLNLGVDRIILGSLVLKEPENFKKILKKYKERIIVAVDVKRDKIYYKAWQEKVKKELSSFLEDLIKLGVKTVICTDIERDGTLKGPNVSLYKKLVKTFPKLEIIASGGIRDGKDLEKLSKIGVAGVIIGKAIYEKKILLTDLPKKIIPCLDCKLVKGKWKVVKGIKFENLREVGDPVKLAEKYSEEDASEIAMWDVSASQGNRDLFFNLVKKVAKAIKVPLFVRGGIASLSDIERLLKAGADKVAINTRFVKNPDFLNRAIKKFGPQRVVVSIEAKKRGKKWNVCILGGTKETRLDTIKWAKEMERRGAETLLVTSSDRHCTQKGYDLELLKKLKEATFLSVIASGGAGKIGHFLEAFKKGKADAVLAASLFHSREVGIPELKKHLKRKGINVS